MTISLLVFGLLLGMRHALEADHVAAVTALARGAASLRANLRLAGLWGLGHAGTVFVAGALLLALDLTLPERLDRLLDGAVGVMLIVLGVGVLRRVRAHGVHVHAHRHGDRLHLHVHSHRREAASHGGAHDHAHRSDFRSLAVGAVHGLAGSAALLLLSVQETGSTAQALGLLASFGAGSMAGMMLFSVAIALPGRVPALRAAAASRWLDAAVGAGTLVLGGWMVFGTLSV